MAAAKLTLTMEAESVVHSMSPASLRTSEVLLEVAVEDLLGRGLIPYWPSQGSARSVLPRQLIWVTTMWSVALAALLSYPSVQDIRPEMRGNDNKVGHLLLCSSQLVDHIRPCRPCTWPPYIEYKDQHCRLLEGLSVFKIFIKEATVLARKSLFSRTSRMAPFLSLNLRCLPGRQTSHPGFHHSEWAQLPGVSQENLAGENSCIFC